MFDKKTKNSLASTHLSMNSSGRSTGASSATSTHPPARHDASRPVETAPFKVFAKFLTFDNV